jgi:hypothetical protein
MAATPDRRARARRQRTSQPHSGQPGAGRPPRPASRRHRRPQPGTALDTVAAAFRLLTTGPQPLCADGAVIGHGLPGRPIPLPELRALLLHPATGRAARDAAWRYLLVRVRSGEAAWVIGAVGVGLPALRAMVTDLAEGHRRDAEEVSAAALAGFVEGLHRIDPDRPGVMTRLRWAAYRAGLAARYTRDGLPVVCLPVAVSAAPPLPWGHPDLVLADAVAQGVLSPLQAELIGRSRLEDRTLKQAAAELGLGYEAACKARQRGEARLVEAISSGKVAQRLSAAATETGLPGRRDPHVRPGVGTKLADGRGRSTASGGTPRPDPATDEKGVFRGPAHQPSTPSPHRPASSSHEDSSPGARCRPARRRRQHPPGASGDPHPAQGQS